MGRKSHYGDGSIFQRSDGRWQADAMIGGKRKSFYGKSKRDAEQKMKSAQRDFEHGEYVEPSRLKVKEYLESWLEAHRNTIKESSYPTYKTYLNILIPALGHHPLQKLSLDHIQALYNQHVQKETLAPASIHLMHHILNKSLSDAVVTQKIVKNPAQYVKLPRIDKHEVVILMPEELEKLTTTAQLYLTAGNQVGAIVLVLLATGIRIGECLALHWSNVNMGRGTLAIESTLSWNKEIGNYEDSPKSRSSKRVVPLPGIAISILQEYRLFQLQLKLQAGSNWENKDLIFCNQHGGYTYYSTIRRHFKKLLASAELEDMPLHDLRHNMATLLLARRIPMKTVQELLGHSSIKITGDIYGHVTSEMYQDATKEMNSIFKVK